MERRERHLRRVGDPAGADEAQTWEYLRLPVGGGAALMEQQIAALEGQGWVLVAIAPPHHRSLTLLAHLRRPVRRQNG